MDPWLQKVRHDLVKRAAWAARDLRDGLPEGRQPGEAEARALRAGLLELRDGEGATVRAGALFARLRAEAPAGLPAAALDELQRRVAVAEALVQAPALETDPAALQRAAEAALEVESAFVLLVRAHGAPARKGS